MDSEIGKKQPHLLKLEAIHKCMECSQPFSMMRKKYNCRACGIVVCAKCSGQKQILSFEDKACRVCKSCHEVIKSRLESEKSEQSHQNESSHQIISKDTLDVQVRPKGLLEVILKIGGFFNCFLRVFEFRDTISKGEVCD